MNTASAHAPASFQSAPQTSGHQASHVGRYALVSVLSAALVLAVLAGFQFLRTRDAGATVALTTVATEAFLPGGSVYAQQVPTASVASVEAFLPGGSVYAEQVPTASTGLSGSLYEQQVPAAAR